MSHFRFSRRILLPFCLLSLLPAFLWLSARAALGQEELPPPSVPAENPEGEPPVVPALDPGEPAAGGPPPEGLALAQARDRLWAEIEQAVQAMDGHRLGALATEAPAAWEPVIARLQAELAGEPLAQAPRPAEPAAAIAGINGAVCSYATIGDAILNAKSGDTIYILPGTYTELLPDISKKTLLFVPATTKCGGEDTGGNSTTVIVDGGGGSVDSNGGLLEINSGSHVTFRHMTLRNATATYGGILYVAGSSTLILDDADVRNGTASSTGGGIRAINSNVTIKNGSFVNDNSATLGSGGGVALDNATLELFNGDIGTSVSSTNSAGGNGGAVYAVNSTVTVDNVNADMRNNSVLNFGGAIYAQDSILDITGAEINNNIGPESGGAIYITGSNSELHLDDVQLDFNQASSAGQNAGGGAIYATSGVQITVDNSEFRGNSTNNIGGALAGRNNTDVVITGTTLITANTSSGSGGAIYMSQSSSDLLIANSTLSDNEAGSSGGAIQATFAPVTLDNATLDHNRADYGGAIRLQLADATLRNNSQIIYNNALYNGGGFYIYQGTLSAITATIGLNVADDPGGGSTNHGGGIYATDATLVFTGTYLTLNTARHKGGGIFLSGSGSSLVMSESGFSANETTHTTTNGGGGALYAEGFMPVTLEGAVVEGNSAIGSGGAIQLRSSPQLLLDDSIVMYNTSSGSGGGIYAAQSSSSVTILGGSLFQNTAGTTGGAIQATFTPLLLQNTEIYENEAGDGGGMMVWLAEAILDNVIVRDNTVTGVGGGIYANQADVTLRSTLGSGPGQCDPATLAADHYCTELRNNSAGEYGGAAYVTGSTSANASGTFTATQSAFMNNSALLGGAALYTGAYTPTVNLDNVLVMGSTDDEAVEIPAAARITVDSSSLVANYDNPLYVTSSSAHITLTNSILWDNLAGPYVGFGSPFTRTCNHSQSTAGGQSMGAAGTDPQFEVTARGQYRLSAGSPARDVCNDGPAADLDGLARPQGSNHDRGAFERVCPLPATAVTPAIAVSGSDITLSWSAVGGATGYAIYRLADDPYGPLPGPHASVASSPYVDNGAAGNPSTNYTYVVAATNDCGDSGPSSRLGEFDFSLTPGN